MAEARMGVDPHPWLERAGFEVDTSNKVLQAHYSTTTGLVVYVPSPKFLLRSARRYIWRSYDKLRVGLSPLPLWLVLLLGTGTGLAVLHADSSRDPKRWPLIGPAAVGLRRVLERALGSFDRLIGHTPAGRLSGALPAWVRESLVVLGCSVSAAYLASASQRFVLRQLLLYHGWMHRIKSLKTTLWGMSMQYVFIRRVQERLWAFQHCLPTLPLPALQPTIDMYLSFAKATMPASEFAEFQEMGRQFLLEEGPQLQRTLWIKWLLTANYVSDWWLQYIYLASRSSLCINSNWYGVMTGFWQPTTDQAARAAVLTYQMVRIKRQLDNAQFEPQVVAGVAPLCMAQYDYIFSTTRVPGAERDTLVKADEHESRHAVVMHGGHLYKLPVYGSNMRPLTPLQLLEAIRGILRQEVRPDASMEDDGAALIPALTTLPRTEWAMHRRRFFVADSRHNASRLEVIEKAIFVVSLDDFEVEATSRTDPGIGWAKEGKMFLCGNGYNRWCDKSVNFVVNTNGRAGIHAEHSWGDAPAACHIMELCCMSDVQREFYNRDGTVKVLPQDTQKKAEGTFEVIPAERINFHVTSELAAECRKAVEIYKPAVDDLDLNVMEFDAFGKNLMSKGARVSPDAFIQMALQLAYYRDQGSFVQTYESSMTRLFAFGRTETIRSCSQESCAMVRALENVGEDGKKLDGPRASAAEIVRLLRAACDAHQAYTFDTMCGTGVDRHLFALFVVARGRGIPTAFLEKVFAQPWRLSTSQTPLVQVTPQHYKPCIGPSKEIGEQMALGKKVMNSPGGGFGPIADDGYGVCYSIWPDHLYFNVSAKFSAENTDGRRFVGRIRQALLDLKALVDEAAAAAPKKGAAEKKA